MTGMTVATRHASVRHPSAPLRSREAIESASAILRARKLPCARRADQIADALDAVALAMALSGETEGATIALAGCHHGEYSVLCIWLCACPEAWPMEPSP
jgi:hypothetical protein